jgi:MFS transporter, DHA3 family, tetracycline resistance protein
MVYKETRTVKKLDAYKVYLFMDGATALLFSMIFTASSVYQVTVAGLTPLQLVLVGTVLEATVFLFEVPTGVVADVYSRRLSIIIGMFLIGLGFIIEGSFPLFWMILLAQLFWGVGFTFTSGANQAWITDEIGEAAAGKAFLRSNQVGNLTALLGIGAGMALGNLYVNLPIQLGGVGLIALGVILILVMPETGFKPVPRENRDSWQNMVHTFREGLATVQRRPSLTMILIIGLIYGMYSEGLDRLWVKHFLDNFTLPLVNNWQPVTWVGLIRMLGLVMAVGVGEIAHRKVDTASHAAIARALFAISALLVAGLYVFSLAGVFIVALLAYWLIDVTRNVIGPLYSAWVNQRLDSHVRATVLSMSSQVDAIGQITGGPIVGLVGSWLSVRAALLASSLILTPVLALYARLMRQNHVVCEEPIVNTET